MGGTFSVGNSRSHGEIGGTSCRTVGYGRNHTAARARAVVNVPVVFDNIKTLRHLFGQLWNGKTR